jgi:hypothetical protein
MVGMVGIMSPTDVDAQIERAERWRGRGLPHR